MELTSKGKRLELQVVGYEFPDPEICKGYYDRNWLMIHCDITIPRGHWSFTEPFMLTWDVQRWSEWFDNIAENNIDDLYEVTYDGVIFLELVDCVDDLFHLKVDFQQEGRPPWVKVRTYLVKFHVTADQLHAAAAALRADLHRFPLRDPNPFIRR